MLGRNNERYFITPYGKEEYSDNNFVYRYPSPRNKILKLLSSGVGYRAEAIIDFVKQDKRVCCQNDGMIMGELASLVSAGFVKVGV